MAIFASDYKEEEEAPEFNFVVTSDAANPIPTDPEGFAHDPRTMRDAEIYFNGVGRETSGWLDTGSYGEGKRDLTEALRDEDWRIDTMIDRAGLVDGLTDMEKDAGRRLRENWNKVAPESIDDYLEATKDIGIDFIANPLSILALAFTGGTGNVVLQTAGKEAAKASLKNTLRNFAASNTTKAQTIKGFVAGAAGGASYEDQLQRFEVGLGITDKYDIARTA